MPNVELLQRTMQYIKDHPDQHRQGMFIDYCGTSACFAGWAGLFSGMTADEIRKAQMYQKGAELLGIGAFDATTLFDADNTRPMLELMVKDLVNGDELRPPYHYARETKEA